MIKLKIIDILEKLSKNELRKFSDYVKSPYFNKSKNLIKLSEIYKKNINDFDKESFTKEKVFHNIFPGKDYNDEVFRNLNSDLLKLAEDYLAQMNYERDDFSRHKHLLFELVFRSLFPLFEKNFKEAEASLNSVISKKISYYYDKYQLYEIKEFYNGIMNILSAENIKQMEVNLINFFISSLLEKYRYIHSQKRFSEFYYKFNVNDEVLTEIIKAVPENEKVINLYHKSYKLESTYNKKYYSQLMGLNDKYGYLMDRYDQYNNYIMLINFIKATSDKNDVRAMKKIFQLRKGIIEKNLYVVEDNISYSFFINIVKAGLRVKEFEWIKNFINEYQNIITPKQRNSTIEFCLAYLNFEQAEFNIALSHLAKVNFDFPYFYFEVKLLSARIFWELNETGQLENAVNSFRLYVLKNKKLDPNEYSGYSILFKCMSELLHIRTEEKYYKLIPLRKKIEKDNYPLRHWFLEKINELLPKKTKR